MVAPTKAAAPTEKAAAPTENAADKKARNAPPEDATPQQRWMFYAENRLGRLLDSAQSLVKLVSAQAQTPDRYFWSRGQAEWLIEQCETAMTAIRQAYEKDPVPEGEKASREATAKVTIPNI